MQFAQRTQTQSIHHTSSRPSSNSLARTGVLLLHGLGGSPAELYPLTMALRSRGYQISAPTVEGLACGTDLDSQSRWQDWLKTAEEHFDALAAKCDTVHVCGFCGGALLGTLMSLSRRNKFGELVMISPTFNGDGWAVPWTFNLFKLVTQRWFARLFTFKEREPFGLKDERIRVIVLRALERTHKPEERIFDISGVKMLEFNRLARAAHRKLSEVSARTLIVHPREDDVSSLGNAEIAARNIKGPTELRIIPDSYHVVLLDKQRHLAISSIVDFLTPKSTEAHALDRQAV